MRTLAITILTLLLSAAPASAQEFDENFVHYSRVLLGRDYEVYAFNMGYTVNAEYFAMEAQDRYENWYSNKTVMLACSGAFSETWDKDSKPVGMTVEDGVIKNRSLDPDMDALVIVVEGMVYAMDLDELQGGFEMEDGTFLQMNPRANYEDRQILLQAAEEGNYTIFQSQLVYSKDRNDNFYDLRYGKKQERRFLATAYYEDNYYNIIIDAPAELELNLSAKFTLRVLEEIGYDVEYIINLDTGGKNIFLVRESWDGLTYKADDRLEDATNLIVFYSYD